MSESLEDEASATKFHTKNRRDDARALEGGPGALSASREESGRVWNPMARPSWDMLILGLIFVVMILAPFEITFLPEATGFTGVRDLARTTANGLFVVNLFVDFCFLDGYLTSVKHGLFRRRKRRVGRGA